MLQKTKKGKKKQVIKKNDTNWKIETSAKKSIELAWEKVQMEILTIRKILPK